MVPSRLCLLHRLFIGVGQQQMDHVRTQMPYALTVAGVAMVLGYLPAGFGLSPFLCLLIGAGALAAVLRDPTCPKVAHNSPFDFPRLEKALNLKIAGDWRDTAALWSLLEPDIKNAVFLTVEEIINEKKYITHDIGEMQLQPK
ncbi:MAG: hypothetical protein IH795_03325 [Bacteroidetes bacterium]|nr:hypothetical protein [Bacteroidota bacterium]